MTMGVPILGQDTFPTLAEYEAVCFSTETHWLSLFEGRDWRADPEIRRQMLLARLAYQNAIAAWVSAGGQPSPRALRRMAEAADRAAADQREVDEESVRGGEWARQSAETEREEAETEREMGEQNRAGEENRRQFAEDKRSYQEDGRMTAETLRALAEENRRTAESVRSAAEELRVVAEELRRAVEEQGLVAAEMRETLAALSRLPLAK